MEFSVSPLYLADCVCWCLWHNSEMSVLSKAEHLLWRHSKWRVWEGVLLRQAGLVGGTRSFWRGYARMGGSLRVGEPEQRTEALPRCGERQSALGCHCCSGGKGCRENSPFSVFTWRNKPAEFLPSWFTLSCRGFCPTAGGFLAVEEKLLCAQRIHPRFLFFFCSSFSLRWDEFGQNRRGSESTAAPRRGPRVSFTENLKQQQRNFRELKQRVFGHWLGRYTARVLVATPFLLWV